MKKIIFGFSTPKKFHIMPFLIRKIEKTSFSHVYIKLYSDSLERELIYQASGLVVNFVGELIFEQQNNIIEEFEFDIDLELRKKILQNAIDTIGTKYGIKDLFGIGLVKLAAVFGKKIKNPFSDGKKTYICSELAATILVEYLGFKLEDLDDLTPKDIYEQVSKSEEMRKR